MIMLYTSAPISPRLIAIGATAGAPAGGFMRVFRLIAPVLFAGTIHAGTVVFVDSTTIGGPNSYARATADSAFATSWAQTGSYSNVSVYALLAPGPNVPVNGSGLGVAYLTNSIGSGTTAVSNQIATAPFSVPGGISQVLGTFVPLFTGLTLGPGTYYLVLTGVSTDPQFEPDWRFDTPATVSTDAGVTSDPRALCATNLDPAQFNGGCGFPLNSYVPASPFLDWNLAPPGTNCPSCRFSIFVVSNPDVPEPASSVPLAIAVIWGAILRRKAPAYR
jgi:hypothetical protein